MVENCTYGWKRQNWPVDKNLSCLIRSIKKNAGSFIVFQANQTLTLGPDQIMQVRPRSKYKKTDNNECTVHCTVLAHYLCSSAYIRHNSGRIKYNAVFNYSTPMDFCRFPYGKLKNSNFFLNTINIEVIPRTCTKI